MTKLKRARAAYERSTASTERQRVAWVAAVVAASEAGQSNVEIAREAGISEGQVSRILARAKGDA